MTDVRADPAYLEELAKHQDRAASYAGTAATVASGEPGLCHDTHGVISNPSNGEIKTVEEERRTAYQAVQAVSVALAAKLRAGGLAYANTDAASAQDIAKPND